jgi:hypothetical protein
MKITIERKVLERALDALEKALPITREQLYAITALREALAQPAAQPKKRETWLAIREGHLNAASDSYFTARPQLDSAVNRRIFYAGHSSGYGDEALQPAAQQEPFAYYNPAAKEMVMEAGQRDRYAKRTDGRCVGDYSRACTEPLYTRPAVPLTTKRLAELWFRVADIEHATDRQIAYARAIEAEHKIGGA